VPWAANNADILAARCWLLDQRLGPAGLRADGDRVRNGAAAMIIDLMTTAPLGAGRGAGVSCLHGAAPPLLGWAVVDADGMFHRGNTVAGHAQYDGGVFCI